MQTIPQMFDNSVQLFSSNPLIWEKIEGKYTSISYQSTHEMVRAFGQGLVDLGVQKGDRVAVLSEGRREWLISEFALLYAGAIAVPLSVKINELSELQFRLKHADCKYINVSASQLKKIRELKPDLPDLQYIIVFDNEEALLEDEYLYSSILEKGKNASPEIIKEFDERQSMLIEDDLANISYTSGTTADPKGIMLSHRNYTANVDQANSLFAVPASFVTLLILPWDHSFAHTVGLYVLIKNGASIAIVDPGKSPMERLRNIPVNLKEIRSTIQLSVPALARNFRINIETGIKQKGAGLYRLFQAALKLSSWYHGNGFDKKPFRKRITKPLIWTFDQVIFSKIRDNFGGRLEFFVGGGALLDIDLQRFFYAIGIPMYQGYGLTEASPVISSNTPTEHKLGSSGRVAKNIELRIEDEEGNLCKVGVKGEVVVKGENVMKGYWKNTDATADTLVDGWLRTGDMGYLDDDGFLYILGRFKSLLIGNDGEKYSPEGIEESLIDASKYIAQCMLYNNQNPYTSGLIVPDKVTLLKELKHRSIIPDSEEGIQLALSLIKSDLDQYFKGGQFENIYPERWLPASVGIIDKPFSEDNGMINSTLKMVRGKVTEHHLDTLNFLYSPKGKLIDNERNRLAIRKILTG